MATLGSGGGRYDGSSNTEISLWRRAVVMSDSVTR